MDGFHLGLIVNPLAGIGALEGRPLLVDSGDPQLDASFPDVLRVWAGYREELLYPLAEAL